MEYRHIKLEAGSEQEFDSRTLSAVISSETPVLRHDENGKPFMEVLDHSPGNADLSMINPGAFIDQHNDRYHIGSVKNARLGNDRKVRADLVYGDTPLARERFDQAKAGHRLDVSIGYCRTRKLSRGMGRDGMPVERWAFSIHEVSSVAVGADHFATGIGKRQPDHSRTIENRSQIMSTTPDNTNRTEIITRTKFLLDHRPDLKPQIKEREAEALMNNSDAGEYSRGIWELAKTIPNPHRNEMIPVRSGEIGMSRGDLSQYNLVRAIRSVAQGNKLDGFEKDCAEQLERNSGMAFEGIAVPAEVFFGRSVREHNRMQSEHGQRDLTVANFGSAGALVGTQMLPPVELLRNKMVSGRLGARPLGGLMGNVTIPRQTAPATAQSLGEVAQLDESTAIFDQLAMSPKRVGAYTEIGKQLIIQSSPDVEGLIMDDLMMIMALRHDYLFFNGTGANSQPLGILQTQGIQTITFGGAASWSKIVDFETALGNKNADVPPMAWVTTPNVRGAWKKIAVALTGATTVSSRALWENGSFGDASNDGMVNGYRAASTLQIPNDIVLFGAFSNAIMGTWGALDLVVDPYTKARNAKICLTVNTWSDFCLRHAESFCASTDAGNQ